MKLRTLALAGAVLSLAAPATAQSVRLAPTASGKPALQVDGRPFLVLGVQLNNSSGYGPILRDLAPAIARSHANTVMAPVGWESIEPVEGQFDFSVVDGLIAEARTQKVRLALLWFGTWKNGAMGYTPAWVKRDATRFERVIDAQGRSVGAISPLSAGGQAADARAFAALMAHLKVVDGQQRTVILVQVENEAGVLGSDRDYSAKAQRLFDGAAPNDMPGAKPGSWTANFGPRAPEAFMAYHTARYVGAVAAAGKAAYDLPLYVNVWPREQPGLERPGDSSPSGGAVSWLLEAWRRLAPAVDVVGVDNYDTNVAPYTAIARAYDVAGNPLFVPETGGAMAHARHAFWTIAQPYSLGISKFGLDAGFGLSGDKPKAEPMAVTYGLLQDTAPFLLPLRDAGKVGVAVEEDGLANIPLTFSRYDLTVRFGDVRDGYGGPRGQGNADLSGRAIVAEVEPDTFFVTGASANLKFASKLGETGGVELLSVEEGRLKAGHWTRERFLNGDETAFGLILPAEGRSLMVRVQRQP